MLDLPFLNHVLLLVLNLVLLILVIDIDQVFSWNLPINFEILDVVIVVNHILLLEVQIDAE
jgi:hypothetical protein